MQALFLLCLPFFCLALTGCGFIDWLGGKRQKPEFCAQHPEDQECRDEFPDADTRCRSNAACMAPTSVCDVMGSMMCVQCTSTDTTGCASTMSVCAADNTCVQCIAPNQTAACTGTTPLCGADHVCHPCAKHDDCPLSNTCLPDGSCAPTAQVAYVDPVLGNGNACSLTAPCKKVAEALATDRRYLKLSGVIDEAVEIKQTVTMLAAPGAQLTRGSPGVILEVADTSVVQLVDLTIANGLGGTGIGISLPAGNTATLDLLRVTVTNNAGGGISATGGTLTSSQSTISGNTGNGISATGGTTLTISQGTVSGSTGNGISATGATLAISRSTISGSTGSGISATGGTLTISQSTIRGNTGGGLSISGAQFDITNNFIVQNGSPLSLVGGIDFPQIASTGTHRLDFNTITANSGNASVNSGINCSTVVVPVVFNSNIIFGNTVTGGGKQLGGSAMCSAAYSDVGDTVAGTGNINVDPMFANAAQNNFHLMPTSPAKDVADPAATLAEDVDGDARPQGARRDMGADEIK
jgi:hypothetical protein